MKDTSCASPSPLHAHTWDPKPSRDRCSLTGSKHLGASSTARSGHRSAIGYSKMFIANLRCCLKEWKSQPRCDRAQSAGKSLQFQGPCSQCRHLWVNSNVQERTLKKRGNEPRTRVPRCFVLGARYSAVVYSSSKTTTYSGCLPDMVGRAWPGGVAGKRLSSLFGKVRAWIGACGSADPSFSRETCGMGKITVGPQVGRSLCSESVTKTRQSVSRLPWRRATPSLLCELTSRNFYSSGLLN